VVIVINCPGRHTHTHKMTMSLLTNYRKIVVIVSDINEKGSLMYIKTNHK